MQTCSGSGMIVTLKVEDLLNLEATFARISGADSDGHLIYTIPDWLIDMRQRIEARDVNQQVQP